MWSKQEDGSVIAENGAIIGFSVRRFISDIVIGDCCFICGRSPKMTAFNDEHVIPEWMLRRFDLFDRTIALPNNATVPYREYKVPCCVHCNSLLGRKLEEPVSKVVAAGSTALREFIQSGERGAKFFKWMALLFLKTHLKDRLLRFHLDARKGTQPIGDLYHWEQLHHLHAIVRTVYTGGIIDGWNIGSLVGVPIVSTTAREQFDYLDMYQSHAMLLRLGDVGIVAVLNDAGGAQEFFGNHLSRITAPLAEHQLREVFAELAYLNTRLRPRPRFFAAFDLEAEQLHLSVVRPDLELHNLSKPLRGEILRFALRPWLGKFRMEGATLDEIDAAISEGTFSTLFNDKGEFVPGATSARPD